MRSAGSFCQFECVSSMSTHFLQKHSLPHSSGYFINRNYDGICSWFVSRYCALSDVRLPVNCANQTVASACLSVCYCVLYNWLTVPAYGLIYPFYNPGRSRWILGPIQWVARDISPRSNGIDSFFLFTIWCKVYECMELDLSYHMPSCVVLRSRNICTGVLVSP
jgi:hypothetical protein